MDQLRKTCKKKEEERQQYCDSKCATAEHFETFEKLKRDYEAAVAGNDCDPTLSQRYRMTIETAIGETSNAIGACREKTCNVDFLEQYKSNLIDTLKKMDQIRKECKKKEEERQQYCDSKCATAEHFESFEKLKRDYEAAASNDCDPTLSQRYRMTIETAIGETSNAIGACREKTCNVDFLEQYKSISSTR